MILQALWGLGRTAVKSILAVAGAMCVALSFARERSAHFVWNGRDSCVFARALANRTGNESPAGGRRYCLFGEEREPEPRREFFRWPERNRRGTR